MTTGAVYLFRPTGVYVQIASTTISQGTRIEGYICNILLPHTWIAQPQALSTDLEATDLTPEEGAARNMEWIAQHGGDWHQLLQQWPRSWFTAPCSSCGTDCVQYRRTPEVTQCPDCLRAARAEDENTDPPEGFWEAVRKDNPIK